MVGYLGGKSRQSKSFAEELNKHTQSTVAYWEPFCGMCSVGARVEHPNKIFTDINPYLMAMHKALADGWIPPSYINPKMWHEVRDDREKDLALSGFVGFGCSFGGIFFSGYARYPANLEAKGMHFARSAHNSSLKRSKQLLGSTFGLADYATFDPEDMLIYADPPYEGTGKYNDGSDFDHRKFWNIMNCWSENNKVFVSEFKIPEGWEPVVTLNAPSMIAAGIKGKLYTPRNEYLLRKSST